MSNGSKFITYLLTNDIRVSNESTSHLEQFFSHQSFIIKTIKIDSLPGVNSKRSEINNLEICLKNAEQEHPSHSIIFINKNSIISHHSSTEISTLIEKTTQSLLRENIPFCYLSKWNESCTENIDEIQGLLITPYGRDLLLKKQPMKDGSFLSFDDETISLSELILTAIKEGKIHVTFLEPPLVVCHSLHSQMKQIENKEKEIAQGFPLWVWIAFVGTFILILFIIAYFGYNYYTNY